MTETPAPDQKQRRHTRLTTNRPAGEQARRLTARADASRRPQALEREIIGPHQYARQNEAQQADDRQPQPITTEHRRRRTRYTGAKLSGALPGATAQTPTTGAQIERAEQPGDKDGEPATRSTATAAEHYSAGR